MVLKVLKSKLKKFSKNGILFLLLGKLLFPWELKTGSSHFFTAWIWLQGLNKCSIDFHDNTTQSKNHERKNYMSLLNHPAHKWINQTLMHNFNKNHSFSFSLIDKENILARVGRNQSCKNAISIHNIAQVKRWKVVYSYIKSIPQEG